MTPHSQAIAFRIWTYCNPRGWGLTYNEVAEELGMTAQQIGSIAKVKGWLDRFCAESHRRRDSTKIHEIVLRRHEMFKPERTMDTPHRYLSDEVLQ